LPEEEKVSAAEERWERVNCDVRRWVLDRMQDVPLPYPPTPYAPTSIAWHFRFTSSTCMPHLWACVRISCFASWASEF